MAQINHTDAATESQHAVTSPRTDWTQRGIPETGVPDMPVVRCRMCGRRLKREPGITNGIGPTCARKEDVAASYQERR